MSTEYTCNTANKGAKCHQFTLHISVAYANYKTLHFEFIAHPKL